MKKTETYSISKLAELFNISTRTIRYYEEIGLLHPMRSTGGQRVFTKKEFARLKLIFRGKKYGFNLEEIKEMIQLFDVDPSGKKQLKKTIEYGKGKVEEVSERINDLMLMKDEMERLLNNFENELKVLDKQNQ